MNISSTRGIAIVLVCLYGSGCDFVKAKIGGKKIQAAAQPIAATLRSPPPAPPTPKGNPTFMDISPGDPEESVKRTSWFKTCIPAEQNERAKAIGSTGYICKNPNTVTDDVYIALFRGKVRMIIAHFSQPTVNGNGNRSPSVDVTAALLGKFGKPKLETSDIATLGPSDTVLSVCAMRGGCKAFDWSKDEAFELELYTSEVLTSASMNGTKDGAIGIKYYDLAITPEFEKVRDEWEQNKGAETAKKLGI